MRDVLMMRDAMDDYSKQCARLVLLSPGPSSALVIACMQSWCRCLTGMHIVVACGWTKTAYCAEVADHFRENFRSLTVLLVSAHSTLEELLSILVNAAAFVCVEVAPHAMEA